MGDKNTKGLAKELRFYLKKQSKADIFSGAVLVAKNDQPIFQYASGFANQEKQIPNRIETKFNLGSTNKMFTGVAIAQLVESGKSTFQDPVGKYLPDYPSQAVKEKVTIHHLLIHTSGLGSFIDLKFRDEFLAARENLKTIQSVVDLFKNRPISFRTGEFHYSSDGYEILGLIIEKVSGQDYYDYIREHIYKVADMPNTDSFEIDSQNPREDIAIGYTHQNPKTNQMREGKRVANFDINFIKGTAGGSGCSTCHDLLNFCQALLKNELLSPEMTKKVLSPKINLGSKGNQTKYQGYGFQVFDVGGVTRIGHPGRFAGVNTRIDMYPKLGYAVIALSNYDPPAAFDVAERIGEQIIGHK